MRHLHLSTLSILLFFSSALAFGASGLLGEFYTYPSTLNPLNLNTIESHLKNTGATPTLTQVFQTVNFPRTSGNFKHRDGFDTRLSEFFYARFTGAIEIPATGTWNFAVDSDEGFRLKIDGQMVVESPNPRKFLRSETSYNFTQTGFHSIELTYFEATGEAGLQLFWSPAYPVGTTLKGTPKATDLSPSDPLSYIRLTSNVNGQNGQLEFTNSSWIGNEWDVSGTFKTGGRTGGDGADAFYVYAGTNSTPTSEDAAFSGYSINYDEFQDEIQLKFNGASLKKQIVHSAKGDTGGGPNINIDDGTDRLFQVTFTQGNFVIKLGNSTSFLYTITHTDTTRTLSSFYGFGARTGSFNNNHDLKKNYKWFAITPASKLRVQPTVALVSPVLHPQNGKINVAVGKTVQMEVSADTSRSTTPIKLYQWQSVTGSAPPVEGLFVNSTVPQRNFTFDQPGEFTVYARVLDNEDVFSNALAIPVRAWTPPEIQPSPPTTAIPTDTNGDGIFSDAELAGKASFLANKYVGVKGQSVNLQANATTQNSDATETISEFLWDFDNNFDTVELHQPGGSLAPYTFNSPNLNGRIRAKAVTNYGIESAERFFDLKIYDTVQVNHGGSYNGKPNQPVTLNGSINTTSYPGATFVYQWLVQQQIGGPLVKVTTDDNGNATYVWNADDTYEVEFSATVKTQELTQVTGSGRTTAVILSGRPTANPGGPYRGGITGGNFSPLQFQGNPPDFIEAPDVGTIQNWAWSFSEGTVARNRTLLFDAPLTGVVSVNPGQNFPSTAITAAFWMKTPPGTTQQGTPISYAASSTVTNAFTLLNYTNFQFFVAGQGSVSTGVSANDGNWHHIAVTWKSSNGQFEIYKDSVLAGNGTVASGLSIGGGGVLVFGQEQDTLGGGFQLNEAFLGSLDDIAIWNRVLSASEIQATMKDGIFGDELGLVGYWALEREREGTLDAADDNNVDDFSPFGRHGILQGSVLWEIHNPNTPVMGTPSPTHAYSQAGKYTVGLRVQSEFGKWSSMKTTTATAVDGKVEGFVRAADLRTPVREVRLTLTSSHVDAAVLAQIANADPRLQTNDKGGIWTETDEKGFYTFEHLPLGSYRIVASKGSGDDAHEFETTVKVTEITLDGPNQLIDFVDLSVYPIGGRIVYSIQKNGVDVLVDNIAVKAQPVGSTSDIEALPSTRSLSAAGTNYSIPLFAGKYLFLAQPFQQDLRNIRIKDNTPGYDPDTGLVTIEGPRTDIDFIDYTTRELTVFVADSGDFRMPDRDVTVSGENGQASGKSDAEGKFVVRLNPGKYTVTVPGSVAPDDSDPDSDPEQESVEVDLTGGDGTVTLTIPVPIVLSISPAPQLFDVTPEFAETFPELAANNPEGFMFYYPPEPRIHTYTVTATANGNPVPDFTLLVTDDVSQFTADPAIEQEIFIQGAQGTYTVTAGLPAADRTVDPPIAAPKRITFRATKDRYQDSEIVVQGVTVLGDVPVGSAARIVSVPIVNYLVLHDPPGDGSYASFEDSLTVKGIVSGMTINDKIGTAHKTPVYPSPWSDERKINGVKFEKEPDNPSESGFQDLGNKGLLGGRKSNSATGAFLIALPVEAATGLLVALTGPLAYAAQLIKLPILALSIADPAAGVVQYEISPNRKLKTASGDTLTDLVGPGKGDIYFGEGWTLGLQTRYRLGIELNADGTWQPLTHQIETYDILERTNQYVYTIRDIENIIKDLESNIAQATNQAERDKLTNAKTTWQVLLDNNLAYVWHRDYVTQGLSFENFQQNHPDVADDKPSETLIFSAGPEFEYTRKIKEGQITKFSTKISIETSGKFGIEFNTGIGIYTFIQETYTDITAGAETSINTGQEFGGEWESGSEIEQSVGFVLKDDDIGDNIAARVYTDPVWGTPLFFQDPGSVTSDPYEAGTQKAVDLTLELVKQPTNAGPFDYHDGAHYQVKVQYAGQRNLEVNATDFIIYALTTDNPDNVTTLINGSGAVPYPFFLAKQLPSTTFEVSLFPPASDQDNSAEKEYSVTIEVDETKDAYQIFRTLKLKPRFADLRAPRAFITAPYEGQRISPVLFSTAAFKIEAYTEDKDIAKLQPQIRSKQPDGVWEPWRDLSGMVWEDGGANPNVTIFDRTDRTPFRREFTFNWTESEIRSLGVGEYALRAVATDKATNPNFDLDPPIVVFQVDDSKPSVLTTLPDYQLRESERIYRGELSVTFTDDMRGTDFSDRTFVVTDLLDANKKVAGFVSYSPALRKAVFVPVTPFQSNGFYHVEIKTDTVKNDGTIDRGLRDLAGNPLDNPFAWTFHTTDTPFEETWSITLAVMDGVSTDANNIAAVAYGALDGEDEQDAQAVPSLTSQLRVNFLDRNKVEFDRDTRPADGRLSHHWFFVIDNATNGSTVKIRWRPSIKLTKTTRQYQILRLVEFDAAGNVTNTVPLDPTLASVDPLTGLVNESDAYIYINRGETSRYFRLDVQKVGFVAEALEKGTSGWKFFSVPITPQRADAFINLGDDIDPLKLYQYDTALNGYKIYPLDLGEVSLQTGRGYFTRLDNKVEVDIGGANNLNNLTLSLDAAGWHAIGNPFVLPVRVEDLLFTHDGQTVDFKTATKEVSQGGTGWVERILYRWDVNSQQDAYQDVVVSDSLQLWEGYWLKTKVDNLTLTIPAPAGVATAQIPLPDSFKPPMAPPVTPLLAGEGKGEGFDLHLKLTSAFASDVTTVLGTLPEAQLGKDAWDLSEPPRLGQTVAVYFDHADWGGASGLYNKDYQPLLKVGESRTWQFVAFTDRSNAKMTLSWEETIGQVPSDTMLYFRRSGETEWSDMRQTRSVELAADGRITKIAFEVRAERFSMSPPADVNAIAGEKQVTIRWKADDNPFIESYAVERRASDGTVLQSVIRNPQSAIFVDTDVEEDATYTYQVSVRFKSGAELKSELMTVTVLPVVKETALRQNYPNPFNPETWIPYELAKDANTTIEIYNAMGQVVRTLDLGFQRRGRYISRERAAYWDGRNEVGEHVASGVYFYVLKASAFTATRKMVILK
ncbi:T9SS type A sorting domain-containing protein [Candidatus Poribacteria bacterium]|nr:T9SS type A sorting domain-containing protein [Candidatus Poribacteria bacterium]